MCLSHMLSPPGSQRHCSYFPMNCSDGPVRDKSTLVSLRNAVLRIDGRFPRIATNYPGRLLVTANLRFCKYCPSQLGGLPPRLLQNLRRDVNGGLIDTFVLGLSSTRVCGILHARTHFCISMSPVVKDYYLLVGVAR